MDGPPKPVAPKPLVVIIRGAMGAGKSTLLRSLARVPAYRFYVLDADAAGSFHPSDAHGEHLAHDWPIEVEILALHAKIIVTRGFNLLTDPGELLTRREVDRFLRIVGRSRRDPRVVLIRLEVGPDAAVA
ncbi:MAG TPA: AAA family ATPase, partial [Thermoplasmata archaeon]|nr:AAA family ATPase [Thermoplasmata archaeon]